MIGIQLCPVDTWFFRDGTPFTMGGTPQENVRSLFPPRPATVVGALRAALARGKGWSGGPWPAELCKVLGDGPDDLGALSVDGPFLLRDGQSLFPVPRHVLGVTGDGAWRPAVLLRPGGLVACDLRDDADVRLPEIAGGNQGMTGGIQGMAVEDLKTGDGAWLTRDGLSAVLRGDIPRHDILMSGCLWSVEPRIGLERDEGTRTAKEHMLYSTRHVRLGRGVSLGARIAGLPDSWAPPFGQLLALGGESRLAECREWEWEANLAFDVPVAEIRETGQAALIALSPLDVEGGVRAGGSLDEFGGLRVVSACLDRPHRVGGWDSFARGPLARGPLPLRSVLPAGSTLFCEVSDPERFADAVAAGNGLVRIGSRQEWGFGLMAPGVWPRVQEEN